MVSDEVLRFKATYIHCYYIWSFLNAETIGTVYVSGTRRLILASRDWRFHIGGFIRCGDVSLFMRDLCCDCPAGQSDKRYGMGA